MPLQQLGGSWRRSDAVRRDLNESESGKYGGDFTRLQDRHIAHGLGDLHRLRPYELPFELWSTVLEQHRDDLLEVLV